MSEIRIAPASKSQLDDILAITRITQTEHNQRQPHRFQSKTSAAEKMIRSSFKRLGKSLTLLCATENDKVVGYVCCWLIPAATRDDMPYSRAYVIDISISPEHRGKSIGTQLLTHAEGAMRDAGASFLIGNIWEGNDASQALFQSQGFGVEMREMGKQIAPFPATPPSAPVPNAMSYPKQLGIAIAVVFAAALLMQVFVY